MDKFAGHPAPLNFGHRTQTSQSPPREREKKTSKEEKARASGSIQSPTQDLSPMEDTQLQQALRAKIGEMAKVEEAKPPLSKEHRSHKRKEEKDEEASSTLMSGHEKKEKKRRKRKKAKEEDSFEAKSKE